MKNPKAKGSAWERTVCKLLSLWVSNGNDDTLFWRSAISGGRATRRVEKHGPQVVSGDICAVGEAGHVLTNFYFIEAKHLANLQLTAAMLRGNGALVSHWAKCVKQAKRHGKFPMMIAKQNLYEPVIVLPIGHGLFEGPVVVLPQHRAAIYLLSYILSRRYVIPRLEMHR